MLRIKCCPKCVGDLFLENGLDGQEWLCVQCGYRTEVVVTSWVRPVHRREPAGRGRSLVLEGFDVRFNRAADRDLGWIDQACPGGLGRSGA